MVCYHLPEWHQSSEDCKLNSCQICASGCHQQWHVVCNNSNLPQPRGCKSSWLLQLEACRTTHHITNAAATYTIPAAQNTAQLATDKLQRLSRLDLRCLCLLLLCLCSFLCSFFLLSLRSADLLDLRCRSRLRDLLLLLLYLPLLLSRPRLSLPLLPERLLLRLLLLVFLSAVPAGLTCTSGGCWSGFSTPLLAATAAVAPANSEAAELVPRDTDGHCQLEQACLVAVLQGRHQVAVTAGSYERDHATATTTPSDLLLQDHLIAMQGTMFDA